MTVQPCSRKPAGRHSSAAAPRFRMRAVTLAVLSVIAPMAVAGQVPWHGNIASIPTGAIPTGGVVADPTTATITTTATATGNLVVIDQTGNKAIITWGNGFNIGKGSEVRFKQPGSSAEAMNYIGGSDPSIIQGTLTANGKVYLINANGILFDGSAQVNVNTLIASSLGISEATFNNGIMDLVDKVDSNGKSLPTLIAVMGMNRDGSIANANAGQVLNYGSIHSVKVDGASGQVQTDSSGKPVEEGGTIMLFAPQVENHGLITANNGQVILAAGGTVYLQLYNNPNATSDYDPNNLSMRGLLVKVTAAGGSLNVSQFVAANLGGTINTDRGNTTLTGYIVNQSGTISANTAATANGSIWLKAESDAVSTYDVADTASNGSKTTTINGGPNVTTPGNLTTGVGSVTQALPVDDGTTLTEGDAYTDNTLYGTLAVPHYQAVIEMLGQDIVHQGSVVAPGGRISLGTLDVRNDDSTRPPQPGRIYLAPGSLISAAGDWVDMPYSDNYVTFKVQSADIANDPMQKGSYLIGQTVTVDRRNGSPKLFNIADKVAAIPRTVEEKATAGGSVIVNTGEFISAPGSKVDVSGGGYRYADGYATTTYLISNGRAYDIATAPVDLPYTGILTRSTPVQGYVQGASAGVLAIDANQVAVAGTLAGGVTVGPYQRTPSTMPALAKLVLGTQSIQPNSTLDYGTVQDGSVLNNLDNGGAQYALQDVTFGDGTTIRKTVADALSGFDPSSSPFPTGLTDKVLLPVDLFGTAVSSDGASTVYSGFGGLTVRASGTIAVPQGQTLNLGPAGSLLWMSPDIEIAGTIQSPGGALAFNKYDAGIVGSPFLGTTHLASSGLLSTAGGWVNDLQAVGMVVAPNTVDGGTVEVDSNVSLDAGGTVDVSGGAMLSASGALSYGKGGGITLDTDLVQGVNLFGYSGTKGGSLSLTGGLYPTQIVNIGGGAPGAFSPAFFQTGGFTQYALSDLGVSFLTDVHLAADPRLVTTRARQARTGTAFASISTVWQGLPAYLRAPASLTVNGTSSLSSTNQLNAGETGITVARGVTVSTDPLGSIALASKTRMDIEGSLIAPGGAISLTLDPGKNAFYYDTASSRFNALLIGADAVLSTAGTYLPAAGPAGYILGGVASGGTIRISAVENDLDIASGAVLDVSGAEHLLDVQPGTRKGYLRTDVASEGGSIAIKATENAYLDGTFVGHGGNASAAGGRFELDALYSGQYLGMSYQSVLQLGSVLYNPYVAAVLASFDGNANQLKHAIVLSQSGGGQPPAGAATDSSQLHNLADGSGNITGTLHAYIGADQLVNGTAQGGGGFDQVALSSDNQILFASGLSNFAPRAALTLDAPELRVLDGGAVGVGVGSLGGASWQTGVLNVFNTPSAYRYSTNLSKELMDQYLPTHESDLPQQLPVATDIGGGGTLTLSGQQVDLAGNVTVNGTKQFNLVSGYSNGSRYVGGDLRFQGFPVTYLADVTYQNTAAQLQALNGRLSSAGDIGLTAAQVYPATAVSYTVAVENVSIGNASQNLNGIVTATVDRATASGGNLNVAANGSANSPVLSAGGRIVLAADTIDQAGTLRAPLGDIELQGTRLVKLEKGSLTSVAAYWNDNGVEIPLVIPYGGTQSVGQSIWYGNQQVTAAPEKQININAAEVQTLPGSTVDIRGGGDIAATEFVSGLGGTVDVLLAANTYAIIPGVAFQASDSHIAGLGGSNTSGPAQYNMVHLSGGAGVPAGDYALLPAYYALLPGAYLVKAQTGSTYANMTPGTSVAQNDGSVVVAGRLGFSGTGIAQSTWSGFSVQSGADALTNTPHAQGQYLVTGSRFFADQAASAGTAAPAMPWDGGRLSIGATSRLTLQGNLLAQAAIDAATRTAGSIGQVDIYAPKIAIVGGTGAAPSGYVQLQADDLSKLDASLMIGGRRTSSSGGETLQVTATDVAVDLEGGQLSSPELWLAAQDNLTVSGNSTLVASGSAVSRGGVMTVAADGNGNQYGALIGLSSGAQQQVARPGTLDTSSAHGNLTVSADSSLIADGGSITVDSTGIPTVDGKLSSKTLAIGARQIALGAAPAGGNALVLGANQLAALSNAQSFVLRSYSSLDLYGSVDLGQVGAGTFTIDSAGIAGHDINGGGVSQLAAKEITLENLSGTAMPAGVAGTGSLALKADTLVLADSSPNGAGFTLAGFGNVDVDATGISLTGKGGLNVAADLNIETARIAAGGNQVDQKILAYDAGQKTWHAVVVRPNGGAAPTDAAAPGAQLAIEGSSVDFGSDVAMPSGRLVLAAHGTAPTDSVTVESGSRIDLSSYEKTFAQGTANLTQSADAGRLTLASDSGNVTVASGAKINLDGGKYGGNAGTLTVQAVHGAVTLADGALTAMASVGKSGSISIDAGNLGNFSDINTSLQDAGFGQSRYLRARSGDITLGADDTVKAANVQLVADNGSIDMSGTIDASGDAGGGNVELDAGQGIRLRSGSKILANGTSNATDANSAYSNGGTVGLYARGPNSMLAFDSGAVIDVSADPTGKSSGGEIVFSAYRTADGQGMNASLNGTVNVAGGDAGSTAQGVLDAIAGGLAPASGQVILEGFKNYGYTGSYSTSSAAGTASTPYADFNTFMNAADSIHDVALATLQGLSGNELKVRAGVELTSSGDMTVDSVWDLTNATWLRTGANQAGGRLVLRTDGNLAVNARLGLPNDTSLPPASGWTLQLAGGADLGSADAMAVNRSSAQGDVTIASGVKVTTSTGDIDIAAGRNFVENGNSAASTTAIYTTGRDAGIPVVGNLSQAAPTTGVNFVDGGSIRITARGDVVGAASTTVGDWLRRTGITNTQTGFNYLPPYWWVERSDVTAISGSTKKTKGIGGIATLGGGDIAIVSGNQVRDLSVTSATSRSAAIGAGTQQASYAGRNYILPSANAVYGGGDVSIDAAGDVLGGVYLVSRGQGRITSAGQVGMDAGGTLPSFWLMGYSDDPALQGAEMQVQALGSVALGTMANPTVQPLNNNATSKSGTKVGYKQSPGYFLSYGASDSMAALSVDGDLSIVAGEPGATNLLPPRFSAVALTGNVDSGSQHYFDASRLIEVSQSQVGSDISLYQYPDANGLFRILAGGDIHDVALQASDFAPSALNTASDTGLALAAGSPIGSSAYVGFTFASPLLNQAHMVTPSTYDGYRYAVVSDAGNIRNSAFHFPQKAVVSAGQDIENVVLDLQNLPATDMTTAISYVLAGRDLKYSNQLSNGTNWVNLMPYIQIAGPGSLMVEAGRDIKLGALLTTDPAPALASDLNNLNRIDAIGNTLNQSLSTADAASLTLLSGIDLHSLAPAQVAEFFTVLRSVGEMQGLLGQAQSGKIDTKQCPGGLVACANGYMAEANAAIAVLFASGVTQPGRAPRFETALDGNGASASASQFTAAYNDALAAANNVIPALFDDGRSHSGDITLYNARVSSNTTTNGIGGSVNLLAPFGDINVGLPTANSKRNIGVYTMDSAAINAYLGGSMNVNLSKVATYQGGDVLLYTSGNGSTLDAGRGSRSARTTSPPGEEITKDPVTGKPVVVYVPPVDVSGSGIRTVSYDPDGAGPLQAPNPGKVYLLAPTGIVDAGEAGVSSASGLVVAAVVVKNADNFSAAGSSVGVPSTSGAAAAPPPSVSDAAASAAMAAELASSPAAAGAGNDAGAFRPTFITAEVLGFGSGAGNTQDDEEKKRRNAQHAI